jgi:Tol biopolymer transport system component
MHPTGDVLIYDRGTAPRRDLWVADLVHRGKAQPFIAEPDFDEFNGVFSPDGRLLAYLSNESSREKVYVRDYEGGARVQASSDAAARPVWSRDRSQLYFVTGRYHQHDPDQAASASRRAHHSVPIGGHNGSINAAMTSSSEQRPDEPRTGAGAQLGGGLRAPSGKESR